MTDADLETLIESWRLIGTHEDDRDMRQIAFNRMGQLIARRSPERIQQMESERGLRVP